MKHSTITQACNALDWTGSFYHTILEAFKFPTCPVICGLFILRYTVV